MTFPRRGIAPSSIPPGAASSGPTGGGTTGPRSPREAPMEKYEYFGGTPEVGIVPKAPHAGPLIRHVFEQEHGRGGFAGKVTHTYHLYPPTNWPAAETLDGRPWAPHQEAPLRPVGGSHHPRPVA